MQPSSAHTHFWQWFRDHSDRLAAAVYGGDKAAREQAVDELSKASNQAEPGIVLEIGAAEADGRRPLIVSADGRPEHVDAVKDFAAAAPALPGWHVVPFRTRLPVGDSIEIALEDQRVGPADIWFRVREGDDGLDLTLCVRGLTESNERLRGLGASLLAEHAVGERDALTMIRSLSVRPLPEDPAAAGLRPFGELVTVFDAARAKKYPPPGTLPLSGDDWMNLRGTIEGAFASVLFDAGLRPVAGHPDYDRRLTVSILVNESRQDGLPSTEEEYVAVCDLGDRLSEALTEKQQSLLALTIMTQGRRDLVFYTSNAGAALMRLEELRTGIRAHRIKAAVERDTYWGMYRSFLRATQGDGGEGEGEE